MMKEMAGPSAAPTQNAFSSEIFLDRPIYNPGDSVTGQVILDLKKKLCCDTVKLEMFGSARVFFVQKTTKPNTLCQSKAFEQEQVLVDQVQDLWITMNQNIEKRLTLEEIARKASSTAIRLSNKNNKENRPGLEHGTHAFSFAFPLPVNGLYTSFDAKNSAGCIRYYMLLRVLNGSCLVMRKKLLFAVVCPKVLLNYPLSKVDQPITERKEFEKGSYLSVELLLEKRVFVPGEPLMGSISIENRSGKSVKYSHLYINQETICYSTRPEIQIHESAFNTPGIGLEVSKVMSGEDFKYPIKYNVPALLPNVDVPNCIQTNYHIHLVVGFVRNTPKGAPISIKIPISIGTHLQSPGEQFPTAPPAYEDLEDRESFNVYRRQQLPPPDYNTSILGLSSVEVDGQTGYTPLTYHYNFAFCLDNEQDEEEKKNQ